MKIRTNKHANGRGVVRTKMGTLHNVYTLRYMRQTHTKKLQSGKKVSDAAIKPFVKIYSAIFACFDQFSVCHKDHFGFDLCNGIEALEYRWSCECEEMNGAETDVHKIHYAYILYTLY